MTSQMSKTGTTEAPSTSHKSVYNIYIHQSENLTSKNPIESVESNKLPCRRPNGGVCRPLTSLRRLHGGVRSGSWFAASYCPCRISPKKKSCAIYCTDAPRRSGIAANDTPCMLHPSNRPSLTLAVALPAAFPLRTAWPGGIIPVLPYQAIRLVAARIPSCYRIPIPKL